MAAAKRAKGAARPTAVEDAAANARGGGGGSAREDRRAAGVGTGVSSELALGAVAAGASSSYHVTNADEPLIPTCPECDGEAVLQSKEDPRRYYCLDVSCAHEWRRGHGGADEASPAASRPLKRAMTSASAAPSEGAAAAPRAPTPSEQPPALTCAYAEPRPYAPAAITPPAALDGGENAPTAMLTAPTATVDEEMHALSDAELHDGLPPLADEAQAWACKRRHRSLYGRYLHLDAELADNTSHFESLNRDFERSRGDEQKALEARIVADWTERRPAVHRARNEWRRLHVELLRLKTAVNDFVKAQPEEKRDASTAMVCG